jgi:cell division transport system permease protein
LVVHRAVAYFFAEAVVNLVRSWRISLIAVTTIGVSLFLAGSLMLLTNNLGQVVAEWRREAKVVVYLQAGDQATADGPLGAELRRPPWVEGVQPVTAAEARQRFEGYFPSVADLIQGWGEEPLPASFEVAFDPGKVDAPAFAQWVGRLRAHPRVAMVDDDRDWVRQLEGVLRLTRAVGFTLVALLLVAATFTIAAVIRLTAHLYRDEIGVMRLVGATELFIRGPFYVEGLLQGLVGGVVAVAVLYSTYLLLLPHVPMVWIGGALVGSFLPLAQQGLLVALGAVAGLVGAVASLRREAF